MNPPLGVSQSSISATLPPHVDGLLTSLRLLTLRGCSPPHLPCTFPFLLEPSVTLLIRPLLCRRPPPALSPLSRSPLPTVTHLTPLGSVTPLHHRESLHSFSSSGAHVNISFRPESLRRRMRRPRTLDWFQLLGSSSRGGGRVRLSPSPALRGQQRPLPLTSFCQKVLATHPSLPKFQSLPSSLTFQVKYLLPSLALAYRIVLRGLAASCPHLYK